MPINPLDSVCLPAVSIAADDAETAASLCLSRAGRRVLSAQSGPERLGLALRKPLAIIPLDIVVSETSGIETCAALRAQPAPPQLPILLSAMRHDSVSRAVCDSASAPFSPNQFVEKDYGILSSNQRPYGGNT